MSSTPCDQSMAAARLALALRQHAGAFGGVGPWTPNDWHTLGWLANGRSAQLVVQRAPGIHNIACSGLPASTCNTSEHHPSPPIHLHAVVHPSPLRQFHSLTHEPHVQPVTTLTPHPLTVALCRTSSPVVTAPIAPARFFLAIPLATATSYQ